MFKKFQKRRQRQEQQRISASHDRPLPEPTERELELVAELREAADRLENEGSSQENAGLSEWQENLCRIRELSLHDDPREFLRWDVIQKTMGANYAHYVDPELRELQENPEWTSRWSSAIKEDRVGHPIPHHSCPDSSGTLIHHAYHMMRYIQATGIAIEEIDFVFEFGGGYGSLCRLFHKLGFHGNYLIFDFPECQAVQTFFLKSLGIPVPDSSDDQEAGVRWASTIEQFYKLTDQLGSSATNSLFVATWSISESPVELRDQILKKKQHFNSYLIAYQDSFCEIDNRAYFQRIRSGTEDEIEWSDVAIPHLPSNNYLFGNVKP